MALNGYIKLHRKLREWGWYSDSVVKDVFIELLLTANFTPKQYKGIELKAGQTVIGRKKLADTLGFSEQQIRTALDKLKKTGEISVFSTNKFSVVTIENWELYQICDEGINQQITNNQPTNNQQITNNQPHLKKDKKDKKDKNERRERESALSLLERIKPFYPMSKVMYEKLTEWILYKENLGHSFSEQNVRLLVEQVISNSRECGGFKPICDLIDNTMLNEWKSIPFERLDMVKERERRMAMSEAL